VTPNKQFRGQSKCGLYGDYVRELDWCVGQVLASLDRNGVAGKTLVVFTSDNGGVVTADKESADFPLILEDDEGGAITKHYRAAQKDAYAAGHKSCGDLRGRKHSVYEGGTRVPYIVRWPDVVPVGTRCDELIGHTDLLATIAAVMNDKLPADAAEDSYDVGPAWRGEKYAQPIREALVEHNAEGVFAIRQGPWKYVAPGAAAGGPKNSPWVKEGEKPQLYNLADDPREATNVLDKHADVAEKLAALLKKYRDQGHSRPAS
jgi:arylsulfatase A